MTDQPNPTVEEGIDMVRPGSASASELASSLPLADAAGAVERERIIRATWADRARWIGGWDVRRYPRWTVAPSRPLTIPPPDLSETDPRDTNTLTFTFERGVRRQGEYDPGLPWERYVCGGIVLAQGPAGFAPALDTDVPPSPGMEKEKTS